MKKFVTFSTVLIVLALAVVLVFAQSGKTTESVNITNADNAKTVKIEFFYHGNNKTEQSFVVSHTLMLKKKYSQKLQITALDLDNAASIDGLLDQDMLFGTKNVICVLNKKFYLANMDIIADKITKYIDFILDTIKHQNPMLADLISPKTENGKNIDADSENLADTNDTKIDKLFCETNLHDLLVEIDKIHPFSYVAEAEVADVYVDANFDKQLLNSSKERFEKTLITILNTYNFYFVIDNDFYVIKVKPMIVNETFTLTSRIDFEEFINQSMLLLQKNETLVYDKKAQLAYFNGSKETYEKIVYFLKAIMKTYEYDGK